MDAQLTRCRGCGHAFVANRDADGSLHPMGDQTGCGRCGGDDLVAIEDDFMPYHDSEELPKH